MPNVCSGCGKEQRPECLQGFVGVSDQICPSFYQSTQEMHAEVERLMEGREPRFGYRKTDHDAD